ncbi:MAG: CopG family transcriptional regulator [Candidatus Omnitrophica bacterium]|nr:CopG family transcriptional regulator [Candidatus Omnitrophota bacterium]
MDKRLGFIGIIIEDRRKSAPKVNELLTQYGESIIARTGIPYRPKHCNVITLAVEMSTDELGSLTGKLGALEGVMVKSALAKA